MRRLMIPFILAALPVFAAPIQSPSQFLGIDVGADRVLADYKQIVSYFRALDAASPRVQVEDLGKTTLGNDFIMAIISSEANMKDLPRIREIAKRLADPRGQSDAELEALAREGKAIVLVTCNIHSTEIASSQMAMEWAYALATATNDETKRQLDNVVLLLVPSLNPDGQIMVTDWYRKYVGTKYEGGRLPGLYHHYVGHDNNRDWFMLTQVETQEMSRAIYHEWYPQVFVDEHQMGTDGPRMFIPPFADPVDPDVHPLIWREVNIIGSNMAFRLEQANKSGLIYGYSFDAYWLGGTRNTGWWKNITGLLLETASAKIATPARVESTELRGGVKGLVDYKPTINHPHPWPGGVWRMRDIMDYERIASDALLETASDRRLDLLRDLTTRARAAVASATPGEAYRIPAEQHDRGTADKMVALLLEHGVEIRKAPNGDYWIPMAQPYSKFVTEMLEPQHYPEVRLQPGKEILRPYDVATWTLPLAMGVTVEHTAIPRNTEAVTSIKPVADSIAQKLAKLDKKPRVAILNPWGGALDEGWTRWLLDQYGLKPASLRPNEVKSPLAFDVFILPDAEPSRRTEEGAMKYTDEFPPEYRGNLSADVLRSFVSDGGTLIALGRGTDYVIEQFNIPVRNVLAHAKPDEFSAPGSLVRINIAAGHPVTEGMPRENAAFVDEPIAFETTMPGSEMQRWVLASYPEESRDVLLSGWINGADKLTRKAAAVAMTYGKGRIVLFGFHPQHRGQTHATFPLLFNAIEWSAAATPPL
ncbi:MAG TPA: M14 family metallopeptidase [Thermoanaerobaculia bacterium]|nr:M14 family metallopeptidase [Thermoanaerobaculia bacterium]